MEHLDVIEDIGLGGITRRVDLAAGAFALEQLQAALGNGVVEDAAELAQPAWQFVTVVNGDEVAIET